MRNNKQGREGPAIISGADSKKKKKKKKKKGLAYICSGTLSHHAGQMNVFICCLFLFLLSEPIISLCVLTLGMRPSPRKTKELPHNSSAVAI